MNYRPSLTRNDGPVNEVTAPVNRDVFIVAEAQTEQTRCSDSAASRTGGDPKDSGEVSR